MNVEKFKLLFEEISCNTKEINRSLIYDIFVANKEKISKENFIKDKFKEISENYIWDNVGVVQKNLKDIVNGDKFFIKLSQDEVIKKFLYLITSEYIDQVNILLQNEISQDADIKILDMEMTKLIYPFYEIILFIEENDFYSIICVGYSD
jgi:hypothetical protein